MFQINKCIMIFLLVFGMENFGNAQNVRKMEKDIQTLKETQESLFTRQLRDRAHKIINTTEFVHSANISLNALALSNSLSDYLGDVAALNNPANQDLGFSLTQKIIENLDHEIFKGRKKAGGNKIGKFFGMVKNVIKNTATNFSFTKKITDTTPVVGSLNSVMDMVNNTALRDEKISIDDVNNFHSRIGKYIAHYEQLAKTNREFMLTVGSVQERTVSVKMLLRNFTYQRLSTLKPTEFNVAGEFEVQKIVDEKIFRKTMLHDYQRNTIQEKVNEIIRQYVVNGGEIDFTAALADKQLEYPGYIVGEARFIVDEIEAISEEYIQAFNRYQTGIEHVLEQSKDIGDAAHIDRKIGFLREKLGKVETAFINAVHVEEVAYKFRQLAENGPAEATPVGAF